MPGRNFEIVLVQIYSHHIASATREFDSEPPETTPNV